MYYDCTYLKVTKNKLWEKLDKALPARTKSNKLHSMYITYIFIHKTAKLVVTFILSSKEVFCHKHCKGTVDSALPLGFLPHELLVTLSKIEMFKLLLLLSLFVCLFMCFLLIVSCFISFIDF